MNALVKAIVTPTACAAAFYFIIDSEYARKERLKRLVSRPVSEFALTRDEKYVPNIELVADITEAVESCRGGIRILWEPQGGGKTTTLHSVLRELQKEGKIGGVVSISPPVTSDERSPAVWYRNSFRDEFGEILKKGERLSTLLDKVVVPDKPVVIVFDPLDDLRLTEDFDEITKDIARDSDRFKTYVVFYLTSNAEKAKHIWDLNGRQKIDRLGSRNPIAYRWGANEVDQWITNYSKQHPQSLLDSD
jgi:hypothetical protein